MVLHLNGLQLFPGSGAATESCFGMPVESTEAHGIHWGWVGVLHNKMGPFISAPLPCSTSNAMLRAMHTALCRASLPPHCGQHDPCKMHGCGAALSPNTHTGLSVFIYPWSNSGQTSVKPWSNLGHAGGEGDGPGGAVWVDPGTFGRTAS